MLIIFSCPIPAKKLPGSNTGSLKRQAGAGACSSPMGNEMLIKFQFTN